MLGAAFFFSFLSEEQVSHDINAIVLSEDIINEPIGHRSPHVRRGPLWRCLLLLHHARLALSGNIAAKGRLIQRDLLSLLHILWGGRAYL